METFRRSAQRLTQFFIVQRLQNEIKGGEFDRTGGILNLFVCRNKNNPGIRQLCFHEFYHGQPVQLRHMNISQNDVRVELPNQLTALAAIFSRCN